MKKTIKTKRIKIGNIYIGGGEPVRIQSMTKTDTRDWRATYKQINSLTAIGCEIIRVAVPDMEAAKSISKIKSKIKIPLVADIHFDWRLAVESINRGADKIRINPGNIGSKDNIKNIVAAAKRKRIPIRIGVNAGSLKILKESDNWLHMSSQKRARHMVDELLEYIKIFEDLNFCDLVVSLKANDVNTTILANRFYLRYRNYPVHLGVTEAGAAFSGVIKTSMAFGILLSEGIGDTIRVSLTANPCEEIRAGWEIMKSLGLRNRGIEIVSCPTCGRCETDLIKIVNSLESKLNSIAELQNCSPIKVAVMGCAVNGPGEARDADIGIAGGKECGLLFRKGEIVKKIPQRKYCEEILKEIKNVQKKI
ncbi:MAG: 4-hydroxy-3-methylbut-2-en-1-yl diphosphate synthase [Elusimicrobia bacterium ADurb.Bin231]|nr:MAG: 4-hydroxy-3-methylbut-2-en-1-yl diphosphate synthase [Elusimicrobia bacterium ADurb.Bin231]